MQLGLADNLSNNLCAGFWNKKICCELKLCNTEVIVRGFISLENILHSTSALFDSNIKYIYHNTKCSTIPMASKKHGRMAISIPERKPTPIYLTNLQGYRSHDSTYVSKTSLTTMIHTPRRNNADPVAWW